MHIEGRVIEMTTDEALELAELLIKAARKSGNTGGDWFALGVTTHQDGKNGSGRITFRVERAEASA